MDGVLKKTLLKFKRFLHAGVKTHYIHTDPEYSPDNMGHIDNPSGSAVIEGLCGDNMEMFLNIENGKVIKAVFNTNGCVSSRTCGSIAAHLAKGKAVMDVMRLSPGDVLNVWRDIPDQNMHCAILAISTLHKALADYMLRSESEG